MLDEDRCRRAIGEAFPGLEIRSARYFAAGWDYELWEINDELLFRFPLRQECAEPLRVESRLLAALAEHLSLAVPRPAYVSDGVASFGQPFFAYRKLAGVPLDEAKRSDETMRSIAAQVARFLRELHSFPVKRAAALGVPVFTPEGWRQFYRDFRAQCVHRVNPLLAAGERERVADFWSGFLDDDRNFRFAPSLVHADLGPSHILVDPETGEVSGVIDFGDARVGDPAIDIVGLLRVESAVLAGYGDRPDETFRQRARAYWQIGPFHEVLYGLDIDKLEHIEAGLAGIRSRVTEAT